MGRSKFPGKPSKLVNKKRVSVLNGVLGNQLCDHFIEEDTSDVPNDRISLSASVETTAKATAAAVAAIEATAQTATTTTTTTKAAAAAAAIFSGHDDDAQKNTSQNTNSPDPTDKMDVDGLSSSSSFRSGSSLSINSGILTRARKNKPSPEPPPPTIATNEKPVKKKTVTFKNILETSDDINIVKKVYNPHKVPSVPIIKINKNRQDWSRYERFARGDIVMPSRLTEVLKNLNANSIDKLNMLTFKSSLRTTTPAILPESASTSASSMSGPLKEANINFEYNKSNDSNSYNPNSSSPQSTTFTITTTTVSTSIPGSTEKRFILPKRSIHSCRVIKPNKKFLDDDTSIRIGRKRLNKKTSSGATTKDVNFTNANATSNTDVVIRSKFDGFDLYSGGFSEETSQISLNATMSDKNNESDNNDDEEEDDELDEELAEDVEEDKYEEVEDDHDDNGKNTSVKFDIKTTKNGQLNPFATTIAAAATTSPVTTAATDLFGKIVKNPLSVTSTPKFVLRRPMLQFSSTFGQPSMSRNGDGPFSFNLNKNSINSTSTLCNLDIH